MISPLTGVCFGKLIFEGEKLEALQQGLERDPLLQDRIQMCGNRGYDIVIRKLTNENLDTLLPPKQGH